MSCALEHKKSEHVRFKVERKSWKVKSKGKPDKSKIKCWNYNKNDHYKNECKATKDESVNSANDDHGDVLIVSDSTVETAIEALVLSMSSPLESWVLHLMEHYTSGNFGKVYLAHDDPLKIVGKGDVRVKLANGSVIELHGVMQIPRLKRNLLSVGQMDKE
ncbi:hypothetical protein V2J09_014048 [Rumex salicifolius]